MDYSNLPGNSHKEKASLESKKISPVANGKLTTSSEGKKLVSSMISGTLTDVKNHTIYDVIIPGIKRLIMDGISIIFWGDTKRSSAPTSGTKTPYTSFWSTPATAGFVPKAAASPTIPRFDYSDIAFVDKESAIAVRESMDDIIDRYNYICVGDLYELARIAPESIPHTAYDWGWYDIKRAEIVNSGNPELPWVLRMPKPTQIKKN